MTKSYKKISSNVPSLIVGIVIGLLLFLIGLIVFFNTRTLEAMVSFISGVCVCIFIYYSLKKVISSNLVFDPSSSFEKALGQKLISKIGLSTSYEEEDAIQVGQKSIHFAKAFISSVSLFTVIALTISIGLLHATMLQVDKAKEQNILVCEQNRVLEDNSLADRLNKLLNGSSLGMKIYRWMMLKHL